MCVCALSNDVTCHIATNRSNLDGEYKKSIPAAPESQGHMGKVV